MASITMATSFLGGAAAVNVRKPRSAAACCSVVMAKAERVAESSVENNGKEQGISNRRNLMFAAAAAAACSVAKIAMAEDPKRGSEEAKKKYAPVCITMPTARICHN